MKNLLRVDSQFDNEQSGLLFSFLFFHLFSSLYIICYLIIRIGELISYDGYYKKKFDKNYVFISKNGISSFALIINCFFFFLHIYFLQTFLDILHIFLIFRTVICESLQIRHSLEQSWQCQVSSKVPLKLKVLLSALNLSLAFILVSSIFSQTCKITNNFNHHRKKYINIKGWERLRNMSWNANMLAYYYAKVLMSDDNLHIWLFKRNYIIINRLFIDVFCHFL